jgi:hypothetical protein
MIVAEFKVVEGHSAARGYIKATALKLRGREMAKLEEVVVN